ncbi:replication initiation factor domain-containing protein [Bacillus mycoides]|uniref:replication initiation factor domain-containing protein n=1 Tax=Bacillus mycoides TaxID=1405 RepID=UPI002E1EBB2B|nr:replication initiation factor domain-containing protein [Bacillus mycoides]MED1287525.1 replication initiation factor domain-containing protein [Bacillus mycoides]
MVVATGETPLLDITIDKLSIVADFKDNMTKSNFIHYVTDTKIYDLQPYSSRNFGYDKVLKSEFLQAGYIELAEEIKMITIDLQRLISHRIKLELEIERESKRRENGDSMLSDEEYQKLFENKEDIQELIEQTNEDGILTDKHKLEYHTKQIEVSLFELQRAKKLIEYEIDKIHKNTDFTIKSMRIFHEKYLRDLNEKKRILQEQINTKNKEIKMNTDKMCLLDEKGFLPHSKKRSEKRLIKPVRFEFNPKYMKCNPIVNMAIRHVLELLENIEVTGIHIALDYAINISELKIRDVSSKTEYIMLNRDKTLETMYIGVRSSDNHLCFYDKKKETEQTGSIDPYPDVGHVTRFEARLRKKKALDIWDSNWNPFDSVIVSDSYNLQHMDLKLNDKIILDAIMNDSYGRYWGMMDKYQKTAWRKKLKQAVPKKLDIAKDFVNRKKSLSAELNDLIEGAIRKKHTHIQ